MHRNAGTNWLATAAGTLCTPPYHEFAISCTLHSTSLGSYQFSRATEPFAVDVKGLFQPIIHIKIPIPFFSIRGLALC